MTLDSSSESEESELIGDLPPSAILAVDLSEDEVQEKLRLYQGQVAHISAAHSQSTSVPYREVTKFVNSVLSSYSPAVILRAATLYINLLKEIPIAFDEACLSSCLQHVCRVCKQSVPTSAKGGSSHHVLASSPDNFISEIVGFWERVSLLSSQSDYLHNSAFVSHLIQAFVQLLQYTQITSLFNVTRSSLRLLVDSPATDIHPVQLVYKSLYPVLISTTSANAVTALKQIILDIARYETSTIQDRDNHADIRPLPNLQCISFFQICCLHAPDNALTRTTISKLIHQVLSSLSPRIYCSFVVVLRKTIVHDKAHVRLLSLLCLSNYLQSSLPISRPDDHSDLTLVADRCGDKVAPVRSSAISSLLSVFLDASRISPCPISCKQMRTCVRKVKPRLLDPKSTVRKAAVEFVGLACSIQLTFHSTEEEHPNPLASVNDILKSAMEVSNRILDVVPSVRLCAAYQLPRILKVLLKHSEPLDHASFVLICLQKILSLVDDTDTRCRKASLDAARSLLLDESSSEDSDNQRCDSTQHYSSNIFMILLGMKNRDFTLLASKAIFLLAKENKVDRDFIDGIAFFLTKIPERPQIDSSEVRSGIWFVLGVLASAGKCEHLLEILPLKMVMKEVEDGGNVGALKIIGSQLLEMNVNEKESLRCKLLNVVFRKEEFHGSMDVELSAVVEVLVNLGGVTARSILVRCEEVISDNSAPSDQDALRVLIVIGSVCEHMKIDECPSETLLTFVQAMTSNHQRESHVRAIALVTLGKLCLCESSSVLLSGSTDNIGENLTRRFVSVFVHELDNATSSATRSNAVVILCDLCRQFTSIVEPFIPRIAGLLSDVSTFVRHQVLSSLVSLLQEDYIKVRPGLLMFQIIKCVLDEVDDVRMTAQYCVKHVMSQKNKSIVSVSFLELIYVLNECEQSNTFRQFKSALLANGTMAGKGQETKRRSIYDVMLKLMTAEQRSRVPGRLRDDLIGEIAEEKISLQSPNVQCALEDALMLLCSEKLSAFGRRAPLSSSRTEEPNATQSEDVAIDTQDGVEGVQKAVQGVLRNVHIVELRECTIPLLLHLRQLLQSQRSPLLGCLLHCLCVLLKPHQDQLHQFVSDSAICSEIEFSMKSQTQNQPKRQKLDKPVDEH